MARRSVSLSDARTRTTPPFSARRRTPGWLLVLALGAVPIPLGAQSDPPAVTSANYRLAARFAPYKIRRLVYSTSVTPRWIEGTERFWYEWETAAGKFFYLVDPVTGSKRQIFDNDRLAAELTRITRDPWDGPHLPIRRIKFLDGNTLQFEVESSQDDTTRDAEAERGREQEGDQQGQRRRPPRAKKKVFHFQYDVRTQALRELADYQAPDNHASWASIAPDGNTVIFIRKHNLYMMTGDEYRKILDARRGKEGAAADSADQKIETTEVQLTTDGEEHYSYGGRGFGDTDEDREKSEEWRKRANISWSKDSKRFTLVRSDQRKVGDLWVIHSVGNKRPKLETYKYDMPGETDVTQQELLVYDLPGRTMVTVKAERFKDQRLGAFTDRQFVYPDSDEPRRALWLADNSDQVYFWRRSRDQHKVDVCVANATTGDATVLIEERLHTYVEHQNLELLASGDMLWWSERDGWAHLYRFGADGTLRNRLTGGPFHVNGVNAVDEARGLVYFSANAREPGEDPYYRHLYRVGLDGRGLTLLTPGNFHHQVAGGGGGFGGFGQSGMSESARFFVNNYSRVNTVPASALFDATTGRRILDLEEADLTKLLEAGYQFPESYTVKAADAVTDLYGVMYKPFDFDSTKRYPVVAYVYPGPQTEAVAKSFSTAPHEVGLAQYGMIVITVGNRGGHPDRSKWYHNYGYGNLRDYGLADKKAAIEQLRDRHAWMDIDRVGIYGHSGGGFMSTAAMLVYPDFFKVAVSSSGNHDNDVYNLNWSEKHHGIKEVTKGDSVTFEYAIERNSALAANLKGHLLLTTGDIDNNVHPAGTLRMADALIKANKRFDFFVFPGQRHGYGNMSDYWYWLRTEYFVRHLLGDTRWSANVAELDNERERTR
ncbi:MAG TPA: DPP IV N-terminal domain-containing protein [Gemmatimonadales bacterium]|jgi:dipeptidyl aminopeptidase/acylaminoacyl peptidase